MVMHVVLYLDTSAYLQSAEQHSRAYLRFVTLQERTNEEGEKCCLTTVLIFLTRLLFIL